MDFTSLIDLAAARTGGKALAASDDFFAPKENLLKPEKAVWIADKYTSRGKWMDGWESRRKRVPGHDWCVVKLGLRGIIRGVNIDTAFFTGNFPSHASLEARDGKGEWVEILPKSELKGGSDNLFPIASDQPYDAVRLNIFPDGGVARLRVYGAVVPDWSKKPRKALVDLAAVENGGLPLLSSDQYYSHPQNLIMPGRAKNMGDGWETKRRRGPGHDWVILRLGAAGTLSRVEVDTNWFKGNYPDSCLLEGVHMPAASPERLADEFTAWVTILPRTKLKAHARQVFEKELAPHGPVTHARLNIYPDGGVSRLRLWGRRA
ncbi:MAG: allantoicase [Elusimicrobiota bacterium]|nr:allantoicase [Elusimicrobiota bacterium]